MNAESEIIECERPESVHIDFAQLIQVLRNLEQELTENQRIAEIHARFRELRCFQHILGTSTSFKMEFMSGRSRTSIIQPHNPRSSPIKNYPSSVCRRCKTMAMSIHNGPLFLSYVIQSNEIIVNSPEIEEPIGKIVRRGFGTDIICYATSKTFTMKIIQSPAPAPAAMEITDSDGKVVGVANVSHWKINKNEIGGERYKQYEFQMENGLSEPVRVMLLVSFVDWVTWVRDELYGENRAKVCLFLFVFSIPFLIFLTNIYIKYKND